MVRWKNQMLHTSTNRLFDWIRMLIEAFIRLIDGDKTFYKTENIDWIEDFEKHFPEIKSELASVLYGNIKVPDWESVSNDPSVKVGKDWKVFVFKIYKLRVDNNCTQCPTTARLIDKYPQITTAWFSILEIGKKIPEHRGPYNGVLRYHLGLQIPEESKKCGIRVGEDIRHWEEGKSLLFDDSHLHEAWNHSKQQRVVLFIDVIRPLPQPFHIINKLIVHLMGKSRYIKNIIYNLNERSNETT